MNCFHCSSPFCGPIRCRFDMQPQPTAADLEKLNAYADRMSRQDRERSHSGNPDTFGSSICGRSDKAGR